ASEGARAKESLDGFLDALGAERASRIEAVSIDMAPGYYQALHERLPKAALCIDPFHVVRLANHALNLVRRGEWNPQGRSKTRSGRWLMGARWMSWEGPPVAAVISRPRQLGSTKEAQARWCTQRS